MNTKQRLMWNALAGLVGAVTALLAAKLVSKAWELTTGYVPPKPNDPEVPLHRAVGWAVASGVGIGVAQLLTNRLAARQWDRYLARSARDSSAR